MQWWNGARSCRVPCRTADRAEAERFIAAFRSAHDAGTPGNTPPAPVSIAAILDSAEPAILAAIAVLRRDLGALGAEQMTAARLAGHHAARRREGAGGAGVEAGVLRAALAWGANQVPPWCSRPGLRSGG